MNIHVLIPNSFGYILRGELLGHMIILHLTFEEL